jgi:hypothetical protein
VVRQGSVRASKTARKFLSLPNRYMERVAYRRLEPAVFIGEVATDEKVRFQPSLGLNPFFSVVSSTRLVRERQSTIVSLRSSMPVYSLSQFASSGTVLL